jgi:hypothetical protein
VTYNELQLLLQSLEGVTDAAVYVVLAWFGLQLLESLLIAAVILTGIALAFRLIWRFSFARDLAHEFGTTYPTTVTDKQILLAALRRFRIHGKKE